MKNYQRNMLIREAGDMGDPEKSMVLQTCERITDNIVARRPTFDGCDNAGLTELVAQIQVEQFERDKDWPGELDRPDLAAFESAFADELIKAGHAAHPNNKSF